MKRSLLLTAVLLLTGTYIGVAYAGRAQLKSKPSPVRLPQPGHWVAFTADIKITIPDEPFQVGHYYRNSVGSERWDVERTTDHKAITNIMNVSTSQLYVHSPKAGWTRRETDVKEGEWQPLPFNTGMVGLSRYARKADVAAGGSGSLSADKGYDAYIYSTSSGTMRMVIPELNFFAVSRQYLSGKSWLFTSVKLEEPSAKLFLPPPGVAVTLLDKKLTLRNREAPIAE